jgi:hypothetical protein
MAQIDTKWRIYFNSDTHDPIIKQNFAQDDEKSIIVEGTNLADGDQLFLVVNAGGGVAGGGSVLFRAGGQTVAELDADLAGSKVEFSLNGGITLGGLDPQSVLHVQGNELDIKHDGTSAKHIVVHAEKFIFITSYGTPGSPKTKILFCTEDPDDVNETGVRLKIDSSGVKITNSVTVGGVGCFEGGAVTKTVAAQEFNTGVTADYGTLWLFRDTDGATRRIYVRSQYASNNWCYTDLTLLN